MPTSLLILGWVLRSPSPRKEENLLPIALLPSKPSLSPMAGRVHRCHLHRHAAPAVPRALRHRLLRPVGALGGLLQPGLR